MIAAKIAMDDRTPRRAAGHAPAMSLDGFRLSKALRPDSNFAGQRAESNLILPHEVRAAVGRVFSRLRAKDEEVALLVP